MKTKFELDGVSVRNSCEVKEWGGNIRLIGRSPLHKPYVSISISHEKTTFGGFIQDKDLERFAVNILKALKSKRLKS